LIHDLGIEHWITNVTSQELQFIWRKELHHLLRHWVEHSRVSQSALGLALVKLWCHWWAIKIIHRRGSKILRISSVLHIKELLLLRL
jgi:hypothetical protein